MDYVKNQKEAIAIVKQMVADGQVAQDVAEKYFPELKKSEDEKIREELIRFVNFFYGCHLTFSPLISKEKLIAWLEKQGRQFEKCMYSKDNYTDEDRKVLCDGCEEDCKFKQKAVEPNWCHHKVDLSDCSEEYRKAYYDGWNNCNMQHSQCKSELDDVLKCLINGMKFYYEANEEAIWGTDKWSMPVKHIIEVLEKQSEKKPVVIPKFRVGDKVKKGYLTYTVEDINEDSYKLQAYSKDGDKGSTVFLTIGYEKDYELVEQKPVIEEHIPYTELEDYYFTGTTRKKVVKG